MSGKEIIDEKWRDRFYQAVRQFYETVISAAFAKLLLHNDTLIHIQFTHFGRREQCSFEDIEYFLKRYSTNLPTSAKDTQSLQEEFVEYELLNEEDIPAAIWDEARVRLPKACDDADEEDSTNYRMDIIWGCLFSLKLSNGCFKFGRLSKVVKTVLILPHSNA